MANKSSNPVKRFVSAEYDFALDGGAVSTIVPKMTSYVPGGSIITDVVIHVKDAFTSTAGSATFKVEAGGRDVTAAIAKGTLVKNYVAQSIISPSAVKATEAGAEIKVTVGTADLTAGVVKINIGYISGEHIA